MNRIFATLLLLAGLSLLAWAQARSQKVTPGRQAAPPRSGATSSKDEPYWETLKIGFDDEFQKIAFPARMVGYVAGKKGVYKTGDGGRTWNHLLEADLGNVHFLRFQDAKTGWFGNNTLNYTNDGGETFAPIPLPGKDGMLSVSAFAISDDGRAFTGGKTIYGNLRLFRRNGPTSRWESIDPDKTGYWGGAQAPYRQFSLNDIAMIGPDEILAVLSGGLLNNGVILRSTNGGDTWAPSFTTPNDLYRIHFADARRGWLIGSGANLWMTEDGGGAWNTQLNPARNDARSLAFAPKGGSFGLAPVKDGLVLGATTGKSWRSVKVGLGYSMPDAAVVDAGWAYVLGSNGYIAHYVDPRVTQ